VRHQGKPRKSKSGYPMFGPRILVSNKHKNSRVGQGEGQEH